MCTSSSQCGNQHVTVVDDKWYHTTTYWKNTPTHIITSATINRRHQDMEEFKNQHIKRLLCMYGRAIGSAAIVNA